MKRSMTLCFGLIGVFAFQPVAAIADEAVRAQSLSIDRGTFNQGFSLETESVLTVENPSGPIHMIAAGSDRLVLSGKYEGQGPATLSFTETEHGKIKIRLDYPKALVNGGVQLTVSVPSALLAHVKLVSGQGEVSVEGFASAPKSDTQREAILQTAQGAIRIERFWAPGGVQAETQQGSITAKSVTGKLELVTRQGNITASSNSGDISADTQMGNISIDGQKTGHVVAMTKMGNILLDNPECASESATTQFGNVTGLRKPKTGGEVHRELQKSNFGY